MVRSERTNQANYVRLEGLMLARWSQPSHCAWFGQPLPEDLRPINESLQNDAVTKKLDKNLALLAAAYLSKRGLGSNWLITLLTTQHAIGATSLGGSYIITNQDHLGSFGSSSTVRTKRMVGPNAGACLSVLHCCSNPFKVKS